MNSTCSGISSNLESSGQSLVSCDDDVDAVGQGPEFEGQLSREEGKGDSESDSGFQAGDADKGASGRGVWPPAGIDDS